MAGLGPKSLQLLRQFPLMRYSGHLLVHTRVRPAIRLSRVHLHPRIGSLPNRRVWSYCTATPNDALPAPGNHEADEPAVGCRLVSNSGDEYCIENVLQEKDQPHGKVYLASKNGNQKFVLRELPPSIYKLAYAMQEDLITHGRSPYLRLKRDTIPERSMVVYDFLTDHLLSLAQKDIPLAARKRILRDALRGLEVLHDKNIVHADIKANNILIDYENSDDKIILKGVQLADFEDAAYVPPRSAIVGSQVGNQLWRSPEAHAQGPVNSSSDIFSFGIVCIYVLSRTVILAPTAKEMEDPGMEPLSIILERQLSYFADPDTFDALLRHLGPESPWCEIFTVVRSGFDERNRRRPFRTWKVDKPGFDRDFMDLVGRMTKFDPAGRVTARKALAHKWFADIDG